MNDPPTVILKLDSYTHDHNLGEGCYGCSVGYRVSQSKDLVAMKFIPSMFLQKKTIPELIENFQFIVQIRGETVVPILGFCLPPTISPRMYAFVSDYIVGSCLDNYTLNASKIQTLHPLSPTAKAIIAFGIAHGMSYLHSLDVIHGHLSSSNILLDNNYRPRISDFYFNFVIQKSNAIIYDSNHVVYCAPERLSGEITKEADVYSYGLILYELATQHRPYYDCSDESDITMHVRQGFNTKKYSKKLTSDLEKLITRCCSLNPKERPTFAEIIEYLSNPQIVVFDGMEVQTFEEYKSFLQQSKNAVPRQFTQDPPMKYKIDQNYNYLPIDYLKNELSSSICNANMEIMHDVLWAHLPNQYNPDIPEPRSKQFYLDTCTPPALEILGKMYVEEGDLKQATKIYMLAASLGDNRASYIAGSFLVFNEPTRNSLSEAEQLLKAVEKKDYYHAHFPLGEIFLLRRQYKTAAKFFEQSLENGNQNATFQYAVMTMKGEGVDGDPNQARILFKSSAHSQVAEGMFKEAVFREFGFCEPICLSLAAKFYERASSAGHALAQARVKEIVEQGPILAKKARSVFKLENRIRDVYAYNTLFMYACFLMSDYSDFSERQEEAVSLFKIGTEEGDYASMTELSFAYDEGWGIAHNSREALNLIKKAAASGYGLAMERLGQTHSQTEEFGRNYTEAAKYYQRAADLGFEQSQFELATHLANGMGVKSQISESSRYYKMSADAGHTISQIQYAVYLRSGRGVSSDIKKSIGYYRMSASQGVANAMFDLAEMLLAVKKADDKEVKEQEAFTLYVKAIDEGYSRATKKLSEMFEKGISVPASKRLAEKYKARADELTQAQKLEAAMKAGSSMI